MYTSLFGYSCSIGDTSSAKELMSELVHLYDVVAEEPGVDTSTDSRVLNGGSSDVKEKEECGHKAGGSQEVMETAMSGTAVEPRDGAITCNSMEMIREKQQCTGGEVIELKLLVSPPGPCPAFNNIIIITRRRCFLHVTLKAGMGLRMRLLAPVYHVMYNH